MKFKPLSQRYVFGDTLTMDIPEYMKRPIQNWLQSVLEAANVYVEENANACVEVGYSYCITSKFKDYLQTNLREEFPQSWIDFVSFVINDKDRMLTVLQLCLNCFARQTQADRLEEILSNSGSGYAVIEVNGVYDLTERVPEIVKKVSERALTSSDELMKAWVACYGIKPNYNEVVGACQNVLEGMLRDIYSPKDSKAQLGKLIGDIKAGKKLSFIGSDTLSNPNIMLGLIDKVPGYRGLHKAGTGQDASRPIAEYILHTTIYVWNLHNVQER